MCQIETNLSYYLPNIFDPTTWDGLGSKMIDLLVKEGTKRDGCLARILKTNFLKDSQPFI